jgi:hypothetical protein
MARQPEQSIRDRAVWIVRLATLGSIGGAVGVTWGLSNLAEDYFSGKPPAAPIPPRVPVAAAPVQKPPPVIQTIVHHSYVPGPQAPASSGGGSAPRPPAQGPAPPPPPPPPPVCHSTPSKPC